MRASLVLMLCLLVFNTAIDWYIMRQIKHRCRKHTGLWMRLELYSAVIITMMLVGAIIVPADQGSNQWLLAKMWLLFGYLSVYVPKFLGVLFDLLASIPVLFGHRRIKALTVAGIIVGATSLAAMWWGALAGRMMIDRNNIDIYVTDLPEAFDGYRIVQFSDLHTGTFNTDTTFVSRLVDQINATRPDAIFFTGDIVNRESSEITPFITTLRRLKANDGVYAILGNHGDYIEWPSAEAKQENMQKLVDAYRQAGARLLPNETAWLHRHNDSIAVIGVENIGEPPFPVYGSLTRAYPHLGDNTTKILLTHNPMHWVDSIAGNNAVNVPLTLSGHTHAMQIKIAGMSPSALRYPTWGGLYADAHERHQLYVNIGCGTIGFPMRLGATPEITVITLRRRR